MNITIIFNVLIALLIYDLCKPFAIKLLSHLLLSKEEKQKIADANEKTIRGRKSFQERMNDMKNV